MEQDTKRHRQSAPVVLEQTVPSYRLSCNGQGRVMIRAQQVVMGIVMLAPATWARVIASFLDPACTGAWRRIFLNTLGPVPLGNDYSLHLRHSFCLLL